ncbi:MAG: hypothetical protein ABSB30_03425 [Terracidiphilus sp.]|jgi:hypothetical protein
MVMRVSDNASQRRDQIDNLAELLEDAPTRQAFVRYYGVIDAVDTNRLRKAYPKAFKS